MMEKTLISLALLTSLNAAANYDDIERIVVVAPMHSPLDIKTNPKLPRQPLPAQDGADLLTSIAGFSLIKKGSASSDPVFRGMAGSRLNIVSNGGLTLGGCGNRMDPPTAYITPQSYDTLTVIKGPQTVLYGSGNSAATVVFERTLERLDKPRVDGFANIVFASANRSGLNTDIKAGSSEYYVRFSGSYNRADDFSDGDNNVIHSQYKRWNADSEFAYTPADDKIISITYGRSDGEAAYADRMMDGSLFDRTHTTIRTDWAINHNIITNVEAQWYYNNIDHVMDNYSLRPFVPNMMMKTPTASNPDRRTQGGKLLFDANLNEDHTVKFGVDHQQDRHRNRVSRKQFEISYDTLPRSIDGEFEKTGVFAEYEYSLDKNQQVVTGLRLDHWQATDERQSISSMMKTMPNPSASLTRRDNLWSGFARFQQQSHDSSYFIGFGHTERFPDYWELLGGSRQGPDSLSAFHTNIEKTNQFDIGLLHQRTQWQGSVSVFYSQIDDYILTDNLFNQGSMNNKVTRNVDAQTYGFEADVSYDLTKNWISGASINYVRASNLSDHLPLAQQPPLQARFTLDYQRQNWHIGVLWRIVAAQHRVAVGQGNIAGQDFGESAGFGTLALNASYSQSDSLDWTLGVDNVLDKTYSEHLSKSGTAVSGYPQIDKINEAGITLWANVNWRF
ncbi:TonB-dependent copper receptor [Pseudoalteromonas sp. MMG012]|uniref:TonB-dependent copper receptor n=1 Tax=Pseudoalteromonas sp. MMG012 TaxID=2822686 RepID=UPI001FFD7CA6|nr:TonB-dependent copper receptor [Pseudoalteromonas sp. MMG012]